jgi:hypothetical protein
MMTTFLKSTLLAAGLGLAAIAPASAQASPSAAPGQPGIAQAIADGRVAVDYAQFRGRRYYGGRYYGGRGWGRRGWGGGALIGGLAAGALLGGALAAQAAPRAYYYDAPAAYGPPAYYAAPGGDPVAYCMQRFQSYDPHSGTYLGYDGLRHPCP